jgi:hypothetical protein
MGDTAREPDGAERNKERRAAPAPPAPAGPAPAAAERVLALQRAAGNRAVAQLLSRAPVPDLTPSKVVDPKWGEVKPKPKPAPERSTRSDVVSYEQQPEALREVLERSFGESAATWFSRLSDEARSNLTYTYNRMVDHGIWEHVRRITRVEAGEKPLVVGPLTLHVAGKSASVVFEVYDGKALRDTMLADGERFGVDSGPMGALHPGQTSMREFSRRTNDGLHLSIGLGTEADAHIDKKSPTAKPKGQTTQADLVRSLEHHWQEVWPEFLRVAPGWLVKVPYFVYEWLVDKLARVGVGARFRALLKSIPKTFFEAAANTVGILDAVWAGTTFKPADKVEHPDPSQRPDDTDFVVLKEYRFGSKGRGPRPPADVPPGQTSMDPKWAAAVDAAVDAADPGVVRPGGKAARDAGDFAQAATVGAAIAGKVLSAARANGVMIGLDLGPLYHDLDRAQAAEVAEQLTRIGRAARESLAAAIEANGKDDLARAVLGVRSANVQLGPAIARVPLH